MIQFDFTKCGLPNQEISAAEPEILRAKKKLEEERQSKKIGWWHLPFDEKPLASVKQTAKPLQERFENLIVLGIGGSSQGLKTLADVLLSPQERQRLIVLESTDPRTVSSVLDTVDLKTCCLNVISKSGNTIETLTLFDTFRKKFQREQIIVTTEEGDGLLYKVAQRENFVSLPISKNVGGRFSVFSAVGLFPLAFLGVDIEALLAGAKKKVNEDACKNSLIHFLLNRDHDKTISVMMPYADCLVGFTGWYVQLWGESLGKAGEGQTPLAAKGPQDQHSLAQLFMDGPKDKIVTFVQIASDDKENLGRLLLRECAATARALHEKKCPSVTLTLPDLSAETMGELLMAYQFQTACTGHLMGINPYDQPAVERIKTLIVGL